MLIPTMIVIDVDDHSVLPIFVQERKDCCTCTAGVECAACVAWRRAENLRKGNVLTVKSIEKRIVEIAARLQISIAKDDKRNIKNNRYRLRYFTKQLELRVAPPDTAAL
jgi:hypothetical protein